MSGKERRSTPFFLAPLLRQNPLLGRGLSVSPRLIKKLLEGCSESDSQTFPPSFSRRGDVCYGVDPPHLRSTKAGAPF